MKKITRLICVLSISISIQSCINPPQITMNPVEDAQTCIKLYKRNEAKGEQYMEKVITTYYMRGMHSEHDKFANIVAEELARISFE